MVLMDFPSTKSIAHFVQFTPYTLLIAEGNAFDLLYLAEVS